MKSIAGKTKSQTMSTGWIGVDLDGTLAFYEHWVDELHIGHPIPVMVERVKRWLKEGKTVKIFTARVSDHPHRDIAPVKAAIENWCVEHIGQVLEITNEKDYGMIECWDDRCVQVEPNTGNPVGVFRL